MASTGSGFRVEPKPRCKRPVVSSSLRVAGARNITPHYRSPFRAVLIFPAFFRVRFFFLLLLLSIAFRQGAKSRIVPQRVPQRIVSQQSRRERTLARCLQEALHIGERGLDLSKMRASDRKGRLE